MKPPETKWPQLQVADHQSERLARDTRRFTPAVAQSKHPTPVNLRNKPAAPPIYAPNATPLVLQRKAAISTRGCHAWFGYGVLANRSLTNGAKAPVPIPVYRAQTTSKCLQLKRAGGESLLTVQSSVKSQARAGSRERPSSLPPPQNGAAIHVVSTKVLQRTKWKLSGDGQWKQHGDQKEGLKPPDPKAHPKMKHARVGEIYDDQNWLLYDGEVRVSFTKEGARDDAATALTRSKHAERQKKEQAEHKNREKKLAEASKNERLAGPWFPPWLQKSGKAKGVICEVYVLHQDESMKSVGTEQRSYPGDDKSHHAERKWWNLYGNTLCGSIRSGTVRKVCFILGDTPCDSSNVKGCHEWFKETVLPALTKAGLKEADVTIFTTKDSTPNFRFDGGALVLL